MSSVSSRAEPSATLREAIQELRNIFRDGVTKDQSNQIYTSNLGSVSAEIQRIQKSYAFQKKLVNIRKIETFLQAMQQIEQVVQVFLNVHEVVALVWGPIKVVLVVVSSSVDVFKRILETYAEIGEVIKGFGEYIKLFEKHPIVIQALEAFFCDILKFHISAMKIFSTSGIRFWVNATWGKFKSELDPILESMKSHLQRLSNVQTPAVMNEVQMSHKSLTSGLKEATEMISENFNSIKNTLSNSSESTLSKRAFVLGAFGAPSYSADQNSAFDERFGQSGHWIFSNETFREWSTGEDVDTSILYIHGKPGTGKSSIVSRIIHELQSRQSETSQATAAKTNLLYFYFKHFDPTKRNMEGLLRALLSQLPEQDDRVLEGLYGKVCAYGQADLRRLPTLKNLAIEFLPPQNSCWIILDGLDECGQNNHSSQQVSESIIDWFTNELIPAFTSRQARLRLLISGQRDGVLDRKLSRWPAIALDKEVAHLLDIRHYSEAKARKIAERFDLSEEQKLSLVERVTGSSDGMFLYVKLMLEHLLSQYSEADYEEELAIDFPRGINEVYERVANRVLGVLGAGAVSKTDSRDHRRAKQILLWIMCAARPLHWREIQALLCIDTTEGVCNGKGLHRGTCKDICGSLVEIEPCSFAPNSEPDTIVTLVHRTAKNFLIESNRIDLSHGHAELAIFACSYLTSEPFQRAWTGNEKTVTARSGYYGFQDYAAAHWQHHVHATLRYVKAPKEADGADALDPQQSEKFLAQASQFLRQYEIAPAGHEIGDGILSMDEIAEVVDPTNQDFSINAEKLEDRIKSIRGVMEKSERFQLDGKEEKLFHAFQGMLRFKCPKLRCGLFASGFGTSKERDGHVLQHERPFKCLEEECYASTTGFSSHSDLEEHNKRKHKDDSPQDLFPKPRRKPMDIWEASAAGDLESVKKLLENGVDVNALKGEYDVRTPLLCAASHGDMDVCTFLVEKGANIFLHSATKFRIYRNALFRMIKGQGDEFSCNLFRLASKEDKDKSSIRHIEFLGLALSLNFGSLFHELLLQNDSNNGRVKFADFLREVSTKECKYETASELLESALRQEFPDLEASRSTWYHIIASSHQRNGNTLLHNAVRFGNRAAASFLLARLDKQDTYRQNKEGDTPLHLALKATARVNAVLKLLLEKSGKEAWPIKNSKGLTPSQHAIRIGARKVIYQTLVDFGRDELSVKDAEWQTALHLSAKEGWSTGFSVLVESCRVDVTRLNEDGTTILSYAARHSAKMVKIIHGKDPTLVLTRDKTDEALTSLHHAVLNERPSVVKVLMGFPEAKALWEMSWPYFRQTELSSDQTSCLLLSCLLVKNKDCAINILSNPKISFSISWEEGIHHAAQEWWDIDVNLLLLLRGLTSELTTGKSEHVSKEQWQWLGTIAQGLRESSPDQTIDQDTTLLGLVQFAIETSKKGLLELLIETGFTNTIMAAIRDPKLEREFGEMGISLVQELDLDSSI